MLNDPKVTMKVNSKVPKMTIFAIERGLSRPMGKPVLNFNNFEVESVNLEDFSRESSVFHVNSHRDN